MRAVVMDEWKSFDELELRETPPPTLGPRHVRISSILCIGPIRDLHAPDLREAAPEDRAHGFP